MMKIKAKESGKIKFYYNEKIPNKILELAKYCLQNINIKKNNFESIKIGNQREIYKVKIDSESYYFKKYSYSSLDKKIKNIFRKSAAYRSFKISNELIAQEIPVVDPILAAEYRHNAVEIESVFVTKDFGGVNLQEFLAYKDYSKKEKEKIIIELAGLWAKLYENNYVNGDPNLPGVLLNCDDNLKLSLVDVDNFKRIIYLSVNKIIRNLAKFNAHSYSGLAKMGGKRLTSEDRKLFLDNLIKNYKDLEQSTTYQAIKNETFTILKNWDKSELIKEV